MVMFVPWSVLVPVPNTLILDPTRTRTRLKILDPHILSPLHPQWHDIFWSQTLQTSLSTRVTLEASVDPGLGGRHSVHLRNLFSPRESESTRRCSWTSWGPRWGHGLTHRSGFWIEGLRSSPALKHACVTPCTRCYEWCRYAVVLAWPRQWWASHLRDGLLFAAFFVQLLQFL